MNDDKNQELLKSLNWRYATKVFDPTRKIPGEVWDTLERSLVLTPSSYGLQPYRFLVVADPAKREKLMTHSWNQRQVVDASHFVVFAARVAMSEADVTRFIQLISRVRGVPSKLLDPFRGMMLGDVVNGPRGKAAHEWAARQAYIALGNLMTCAAVLGVDACPLEGLDPSAYDRVLGLDNGGYKTVVACALGYRAATDKFARLPKVRFDASELIQTV
jgi:nitroreductase